ncbi:MAG: RpiB/LacA/LacB family sugar-phosphate isomerase [Alphaproteobacteria bacterium]
MHWQNRVLESQLGILIVARGIGMSMAANRHPGVRAALCLIYYQHDYLVSIMMQIFWCSVHA